MWRSVAGVVCLVALVPAAAAQTADIVPGVEAKKPEPFGDPAAGRPLPAGTAVRLGSPRMRTRKNYASGAQFSAGGRFLVVAAGQDDLWWFDPATGRTLHRHEYPVSGIKGGRLLDDGHLLLFHRRATTEAAGDYVLRFDPAAGKTVRNVRLKSSAEERNHEPRIGDVAFDPHGRLVVSVRDRTVAVYDAATGEEKWRKTVEAKPEHVPVFLADGTKLLTFGPGAKLTILDAASGAAVGTLETTATAAAPEAYSEVVESPDCRRVAAAAGRDRVVVWDAATGKVLRRFEKQKRPIGFDPAGRLFLADLTDTAAILDAAGAKQCEFPLPGADKAVLAPDGKRLAAAVQDAVVLYDVPASGAPTLAAASADVPGLPDDLRFDADGAVVGRLHGWGGWSVWADRKPEPRLIRPPGGDAVVALSADRQRVLRQRDAQFLVSGLDGHAPAAFKAELNTSDLRGAAALSGDGGVAVAAHNEGLTVFTLATRTGRLVRSPFPERGAGALAAVSADGRVAATEGYDPVTDARYVEVYSLATNQAVRTVPIRGPAERLLLTPDGRRLAVAVVSQNGRGEPEKTLIVLDPVSGLELLKLGPMPKGDGVHVALSPDGRTAAWHAGSYLNVYELITGQLRAKVPTPKNDLHAVALAADGRTVAAAAPGWPVALWDLAGTTAFDPLADDAAWAAAWAAFGKPDGEAAYRAARRMHRTPAEAVAFLKAKLAPAAPPDAAAVAKLVAGLDAPAFADREAAAKELRTLGELAVPDLTRVLEATESAEVRQRVEGLLAAVGRPTAETARRVRAVEVLEWVGTADAKAVLKALAAGADGSRQTQEARAALGRMK